MYNNHLFTSIYSPELSNHDSWKLLLIFQFLKYFLNAKIILSNQEYIRFYKANNSEQYSLGSSLKNRLNRAHPYLAPFIILCIMLYHPPILIVTYVFSARSVYWYRKNLISIFAGCVNFDNKDQFFWRILIKYIRILWVYSFKTCFAVFLEFTVSYSPSCFKVFKK